jgi:prophage regulatory protein
VGKTTEEYLSPKQVADRYSVRRETIWRWGKSDPSFPSRYQIGKTARWKLSDLIAWEEKQCAA